MSQEQRSSGVRGNVHFTIILVLHNKYVDCIICTPRARALNNTSYSTVLHSIDQHNLHIKSHYRTQTCQFRSLTNGRLFHQRQSL